QTALFHTTQFYFRLGVVQREIDDLLNDGKKFGIAGQNSQERKLAEVKKRYAVVTGRFQDTFGPALNALKSLKAAPAGSKVEDAAVRAYEHINGTGIGLRKNLECHKRSDSALGP